MDPQELHSTLQLGSKRQRRRDMVATSIVKQEPKHDCRSHKHPVSVQITFLYMLLWLVATAGAQQCTVCRDGTPVPFPDKKINVEGINIDTCGTLDFTSGLLGVDTQFCQSIRSIGTLCGCALQEGACTLCYDGSDAAFPEKELAGYPASDYIFGSPEGVLMTCETMQAVLHSYSSDNNQCMKLQLEVAELCGCPSAPSSAPIKSSITVPTTSPSSSPSAPKKEFSRCPVCPDGSPITIQRELDLGDLPVNSCADLNNFAALIEESDTECAGLQSLGTLCGCPPPPNACTLCPNGEPVPKPNQTLDWFEDFLVDIPDAFKSIGGSLTCELMEAITLNPPQDLFQSSPSLVCIGTQMKSSICGCSRDWRQLMLAWGYRVSGMVSMIGSIAIVVDVTRKRKFDTTYHQLVLGMSFFDSISSFAYMMAAVFYPRLAGFYKAQGSNFTCKLQGFMIQLGLTSVFYNFALSMYFLLVICFNWKEHKFQKYQLRIHLAVIILGFGLACGALPFYGPQLGVCYITQPPAASSWLPLGFFYTLPVSTVLFVLVAVTGIICRKVYKQHLASLKWRARRNARLTRKVFWQSFFYVMAFLSTLPFVLLSYYSKFPTMDHFWIFVFAAILTPSQGLMNALVYFQRLGGSKRGTPAKVNTTSSMRGTLKKAKVFLQSLTRGSRDDPSSKGSSNKDNSKSFPEQEVVNVEPTTLEPSVQYSDTGYTDDRQFSSLFDDDNNQETGPEPNRASIASSEVELPSPDSLRLSEIEDPPEGQPTADNYNNNYNNNSTLSRSTSVLFGAVEEYWRLVEDSSLPTSMTSNSLFDFDEDALPAPPSSDFSTLESTGKKPPNRHDSGFGRQIKLSLSRFRPQSILESISSSGNRRQNFDDDCDDHDGNKNDGDSNKNKVEEEKGDEKQKNPSLVGDDSSPPDEEQPTSRLCGA